MPLERRMLDTNRSRSQLISAEIVLRGVTNAMHDDQTSFDGIKNAILLPSTTEQPASQIDTELHRFIGLRPCAGIFRERLNFGLYLSTPKNSRLQRTRTCYRSHGIG